MKRLNGIALAAAISIALGACTTPQAAAPTSAPAPTTAPAEPTVAATEVPAATEAPAVTEAPAATSLPTASESPTAGNTAATQTDAAAEAATFQIDSSRSQATFTLNEVLLGNPTTVVGSTPKVNGTITVDWSNPANSKVGTIEIDASDLTTDQDRRNGAIRRFILQTNQFPTITFEPTAIEGLPEQVQSGDALTFKVTGNLKIREISNPVTFDVTATANSDNELSGSANTTITRAAYELTIPSVPSVADVTDEVALKLDFVAMKQ